MASDFYKKASKLAEKLCDELNQSMIYKPCELLLDPKEGKVCIIVHSECLLPSRLQIIANYVGLEGMGPIVALGYGDYSKKVLYITFV